MKNNQGNSGGYYAIKGFEFQIDKTILELLKSNNLDQRVSIEKIQDIDSDNFVMQVKYKETQKYSPSKIKNPIIQLVTEFAKYPSNDNSKTYYLYCYFQDKREGSELIDLDYLDKILGVEKNIFCEEIKTRFVNKFILAFSPTFNEQFELVITEIMGLFGCSQKDEAILYYSNMANHIRKIIVEHPNIAERFCTKRQVIEPIKYGKKIIFDAAYMEYQGEQGYLKYVKSRFSKIRKNQESIIFFGDITLDRSVSIGKLILDILENHYTKATSDIKPLTFIIHNNFVWVVKKYLINNNVPFNDGYEHIQFNSDLFFSPPVINKKIRGGKATESLERTSFKIRILSRDKFMEIKKHDISPQIIYYFDSDVVDAFDMISFMKIDKLNTKQIADIFSC